MKNFNAIFASCRTGLLMLGLLCLPLTPGCGRGGPTRYHLSGSVTHGGVPVPAGSIMLTPDAAKGNSGMAVSIPIRDGRYDTKNASGGHIGGPHIARISGMSGASDDEFAVSTLLFPAYETEVDLPKSTSTLDLQVPADWVLSKTPAGPIDHGP